MEIIKNRVIVNLSYKETEVLMSSINILKDISNEMDEYDVLDGENVHLSHLYLNNIIDCVENIALSDELYIVDKDELEDK